MGMVFQTYALWPHLRVADNVGYGLRRRGMNRTEVAERVRQVLLELLPAGSPRAEDVSRRLNLSKRSLYRRLSEEGATFQQVLDQTRHTLALHYLKDEALQLSEISFLLGFSDPRSFYRAFRGWTGQTPTEARMGLTA